MVSNRKESSAIFKRLLTHTETTQHNTTQHNTTQHNTTQHTRLEKEKKRKKKKKKQQVTNFFHQPLSKRQTY